MSTKRLVAVLLLAFLGNPAAAAEPTELQTKNPRIEIVVPEEAAAPVRHKRSISERAKKVLTLLGHAGVDNRDMRGLVSTVDSRIKNGYFNISEQRIPQVKGKLTFRYRLGGSVDPVLSATNKHGVQRLELSYKPSENSRWEAVATKKYVIVNYRIPLGEIKR